MDVLNFQWDSSITLGCVVEKLNLLWARVGQGEGWGPKAPVSEKLELQKPWIALLAQDSTHQRLFLSQDMHVHLFPSSF